MRHLSASEHAERLARYEAGLSDGDIARSEGVNRAAVRLWRKNYRLPAKHQRCGAMNTPQSLAERMTLYKQGLSDSEIGRKLGFDGTTIRLWRKSQNLPRHRNSGVVLNDAENASRMLLYQLGWSDERIGQEQRVSSASIRSWRLTRNLSANGSGWTIAKRKMPSMSDVLARIKRAMPVYLSPADRDDAAGDLCLAVMSGAIPLEEIERRAKTFGNRVINDYASKWGPRSLDEDLGEDGDGFRMIDMIRDERSSSWLEEMGASAW